MQVNLPNEDLMYVMYIKTHSQKYHMFYMVTVISKVVFKCFKDKLQP